MKPICPAICSAGIPTASRIARNHPSGGRGCSRARRYHRTLRSKSNLARSRITFCIARPSSFRSLAPLLPRSLFLTQKMRVFARKPAQKHAPKPILQHLWVILCNPLREFAKFFIHTRSWGAKFSVICLEKSRNSRRTFRGQTVATKRTFGRFQAARKRTF